MLIRSLLTLAIAITPFSTHAEEGVEVTKVTDNIHVLVSPMGGNVVLSSGSDGAFIIDDQLTGRSEIIEDAVEDIADEEVKFILNTHYHFDHTGGNEYFGEEDAVIIAQDNVRKRLSTKQFIAYFNKELPPLSKEGLPVVTFAEGLNLHYNDDDVRIIHLPNAHTDGDATAYFAKQNVLAAGDTIFNGMYPFIDTEHGGSIKGLVGALDTLLTLADDNTKIIPGHGAVMNKSEMQEYRDMLANITDVINAAVQSGKTLEETIALKPTQYFNEGKENGIVKPDDFVKIVYEDLKK